MLLVHLDSMTSIIKLILNFHSHFLLTLQYLSLCINIFLLVTTGIICAALYIYASLASLVTIIYNIILLQNRLSFHK